MAKMTMMVALPEIPIRVELSRPGMAVSSDLYGHDLEFTRHDLFEGLSAEMLANRKFTTLADAVSWPRAARELAASGIDGAARWNPIGNASIDAPLWENASTLVTGDLGHSIRCDPAALCGVQQRGWLDGFNAGASAGSAIVMEAGTAYTIRLVLKSAPGSRPSQQALGTVVASLTSDLGTPVWSHSYPLPAASDGWTTVKTTFKASVTTANATLQIAATQAPTTWWLGSASLSRADGIVGSTRTIAGSSYHDPSQN